jgi:hypothetical protein
MLPNSITAPALATAAQDFGQEDDITVLTVMRLPALAAVHPHIEKSETTAVSYSIQHLFDDEGSMVSRLDDGSTITLYDERDRPIEVQLHDANGESCGQDLQRTGASDRREDDDG